LSNAGHSSAKSAATGKLVTRTSAQASRLLEFFYPIHYRAGMALEVAMRRGRLTRTQVAILWLLRAEGGGGAAMPRKEIERRIRLWFEITSSAITKAIRGMARAPLSLVSIAEDPNSAREKRILLTASGRKFHRAMLAEGRHFLSAIIHRLSAQEVHQGICFLISAIAALDASERSGPRNHRRRQA
jgi:DNA-binding MarR family transcriptional regulator